MGKDSGKVCFCPLAFQSQSPSPVPRKKCFRGNVMKQTPCMQRREWSGSGSWMSCQDVRLTIANMEKRTIVLFPRYTSWTLLTCPRRVRFSTRLKIETVAFNNCCRSHRCNTTRITHPSSNEMYEIITILWYLQCRQAFLPLLLTSYVVTTNMLLIRTFYPDGHFGTFSKRK